MSGIGRTAGRLGGLAVALGAGAAIAAAPAAWASSEDTGGSAQAPQRASRSDPGHSGTAVKRPVARAAGARSQSPVRTESPVGAHRGGAGAAVSKAVAAQNRLMLTPTGQGLYPLDSGNTGAAELSGIAHAGGSTYYAVGDDGAPAIWQLTTELAAGFGWVNTGVVSAGISAPALGPDSEGIAMAPDRGTAWVSDEISSTISEFSLTTGDKVGEVAVPQIYRPANVANNMGLEALTYGAGMLWAANEEALKSDGPQSSTASGSWVRIQQFTGEDLAPAVQFAYRTDPITAMSPFITVERSGLVDLLALPDGRLLSLERELGGYLPYFRSRIYELDLTAASDVSALPSLSAGGFTPVGKNLLWQSVFLASNFEGITLGPRLADGTYGVLLISDDGTGQAGQRQDLYSLVLRGVTAPV
ncbi:esterase-like activity of phytase family protein [Mycolicibacterium sp.]|uniref:esterase-like activity of phytase family protein n=1 Tax=Mycolicibacterium sp. TaxID=2320850 RepID=UPI001D68FE2A|nr:esterase-like activity of phytase family protein [Mycolicibacterium sp.]MCB1291872.1 esterase-like activity of phytase family protein [Mycobacterium sp.]MCB9411184.1 esterase-like activity of phytase family protein [Mycolicibacterium sp.]